MLAQARSNTASVESFTITDSNPEEQDRALASITTHQTVSEDVSSHAKLCPMCEVIFPQDCLDEFEQHVMDHFSYDQGCRKLAPLAPLVPDKIHLIGQCVQ